MNQDHPDIKFGKTGILLIAYRFVNTNRSERKNKKVFLINCDI